MNCPTCDMPGLNQGVSHTLLGGDFSHFADDAWHTHDPNTTREAFRCPNGHRWMYAHKPVCGTPGCDYGTTGETKMLDPLGGSITGGVVG